MSFNPRPKDKDKPKQENLIPVTEYRNTFLKGARKKQKYHAKKQTYNGVKYDSTLEAKVAEELDWQLKAGDLKEVKRQVKIPLMVNKVLICNYYCDFRVVDKHGQVKYVEAKGMELPLWLLKKKLFLALLPEIDNGAVFEIIK
jgi:hypothetical protein